MKKAYPRGSTLFGGLALLAVGILLLLHNYGGIDLGMAFRRWWPLLFIVWGGIKLYERTVSRNSGEPDVTRVTAGEVFVVLALFAMVGIVIFADFAKHRLIREGPVGLLNMGHPFPMGLEVAPVSVPPGSQIGVSSGFGDVTIHGTDQQEISVSGQKLPRGWTESEARREGENANIQIMRKGDAYVITRAGEPKVDINMDVAVPHQSVLMVHNMHGDIDISEISAPVSIASGAGDVRVRDVVGNVRIEKRMGGDSQVSDAKGDVILSGHGGSIDVTDASGGLTINGDFVGPINVQKIGKGIRFVSRRTDMTLTELAGHLSWDSGNLEIVDAPGNLNLQTQEADIRLENPGGTVKIDDRNGNIEVHFSSAPREDVEIRDISGGITLNLPRIARFSIQADCHSCDINSDLSSNALKKSVAPNGDSHLEGQSGTGGPKIVLATTYGSITIHQEK